MKIAYSSEGEYRADFVDDWWRENRPQAPDLFREELEAALQQILAMPLSGTEYTVSREVVIYRVLLPKTRQAVYYSLDRDRDLIIVHSVWGTRRGSPPRL